MPILNKVRNYVESPDPRFLPLIIVRADYRQSSNSTRFNNGKIDWNAQNAYTLEHDRITSVGYFRKGTESFLPPPGASRARNDRAVDVNWTPVDNKAYSRFWGKINYGGASLGVTIASWKQSSDMMVEKLRLLDRETQRLNRKASNLGKRELIHIRRIIRRRGNRASDILNFEELLRRFPPPKRKEKTTFAQGRKELWRFMNKGANRHLEFIFGWAPLVQDLRAAALDVCQHAIPPTWVRGAGRGIVNTSRSYSDNYTSHECNYYGWYKTVYTANVTISNPNLWLANRAGLINLGLVAWDLIPWSFLVGMFVNVNTILSSMTDDLGLSLSNQSITRTTRIVTERVLRPGRLATNRNALTKVAYLWKYKVRTVGSPLKPKLQTKTPSLDVATLTMASALLVQRLNRLGKVFT